MNLTTPFRHLPSTCFGRQEECSLLCDFSITSLLGATPHPCSENVFPRPESLRADSNVVLPHRVSRWYSGVLRRLKTCRRCRNMKPKAPHEVRGAVDGSGFIGKQVHAPMLVRIVSTTGTVRRIPRYGCILVSWGQLNGSQATPLIEQPSYFAIAGTAQHDRLVGSKTRYAVLPRLCGAYPRYHITMEFLTQQDRPAILVPM